MSYLALLGAASLGFVVVRIAMGVFKAINPLFLVGSPFQRLLGQKKNHSERHWACRALNCVLGIFPQ